MPEPKLMTRPWPDLADFFRTFDDDAAGAIADLCEYIASRPIRSGVHGWQSLRTLAIVQTPVFYPYDGSRLQIEPLADGTIEFRMIDTMVKNRQWSRVEVSERTIERFKQTMRQLNWFTDPAMLD